jgi:hypothetical protein
MSDLINGIAFQGSRLEKNLQFTKELINKLVL